MRRGEGVEQRRLKQRIAEMRRGEDISYYIGFADAFVVAAVLVVADAAFAGTAFVGDVVDCC